MVSGWERVAPAVVVADSATASTLTTGTFGQYKYLKIICYCNAVSSTTIKMQFNADDDENYSARDLRLDAGTGSRSTTTAIEQTDTDNLVDGGTGNLYCTVTVVNEPLKEKLCYSKGLTTGTGSTDEIALRDVAFKWDRTSGSGTDDAASYITKVTANALFDEKSSLVVFGANDLTLVQPSLPNGATFLTSDTNKLYMWDGTDTWNEVA